jgi:hypothetical protein
VLDDFSTGKEENLAQHLDSSRVDLVRGDIRDPATVAIAMQDVAYLNLDFGDGLLASFHVNWH